MPVFASTVLTFVLLRFLYSKGESERFIDNHFFADKLSLFRRWIRHDSS